MAAIGDFTLSWAFQVSKKSFSQPLYVDDLDFLQSGWQQMCQRQYQASSPPSRTLATFSCHGIAFSRTWWPLLLFSARGARSLSSGCWLRGLYRDEIWRGPYQCKPIRTAWSFGFFDLVWPWGLGKSWWDPCRLWTKQKWVPILHVVLCCCLLMPLSWCHLQRCWQ